MIKLILALEEDLNLADNVESFELFSELDQLGVVFKGSFIDGIMIPKNNYQELYFEYYECGRKIIEFSFFVTSIKKSIDELRVIFKDVENFNFFSLLDKRMQKFPTQTGEWMNLTSKEKEAWLYLNLVDKRGATTTGQEVIMDGSLVKDKLSLLCALGEAFLGPGGYMGQCSLGFRDCLSGPFAKINAKTLIWNHSQKSFKALKDERDFLYFILNDLTNSHIEIILR